MNRIESTNGADRMKENLAALSQHARGEAKTSFVGSGQATYYVASSVRT